MKGKIYDSAKSFIKKAMDAYVASDYQHFFVNLAISAELLGKAFLADIHPSTIINNDFDSLLTVCGAEKHSRKSPARIKTIGAHEVFKRCFQVEPKTKENEQALFLLADIRNGVVHIGDYEKESSQDVFVPYIKYTGRILKAMKKEFDDFFESFSDLAKTNLQDATKGTDKKVQQLLAKAKTSFAERYKGIDSNVIRTIIQAIEGSHMLTQYEEEHVTCPACKSLGVLSGTAEVIDWGADYDDESGLPEGEHPIVHLFGNKYTCNVCGFHVEGTEELEAAKIKSEIEIEDVNPEDFYDDHDLEF